MSRINKLVVVGGCGHVGLPLGIVFAGRGMQVVLLDRDQSKIDAVNAGHLLFAEANAERDLKNVVGKTLTATACTSCLRDADAAIVVLGTPVDEHLNPTVGDLCRSVEDMICQMPENSLLVLRSTVFPGVTKLVYERLQESERRIHLAYCPERVAEGRAIEEISGLPQIVSAFDHAALVRARELFSVINDDLIELSPPEAELAKLFTNSWRYVNFAMSNEFYILAQNHGLDFHRIYQAVTYRYPRMKSFAKPGFAAGPCLLKDTLQLSAFSGNRFFLGHAAMLINEGLPNFVVNQLRDQQKLRGKVVAVLGMAFKSDSDDKRESLSYKLRNLLMLEAKEVLCTDPYVTDEKLVPLEEALGPADIVILGAPHSVYRDLRFAPHQLCVDVWGFWPHRRPVVSESFAAVLSPVLSMTSAS